MTEVKFFNLPPAYKDLAQQTVQQIFPHFPKKLEIYFPYSKGFASLGFTNLKAFKDFYIQDIPEYREPLSKRDTLRICYSPVSVVSSPISSEAAEYCSYHMDIAIGAENVERVPRENYFRLPSWCVRLFGFCPTIAQIQEKINQLEAKRQANPFLRNEFMGCVQNSNRAYFAKGVLNLINISLMADGVFKHLPVCFAGRFNHNDLRLTQQYAGDQVAYLENFTFCLCPERLNIHSIVGQDLAIAWEAGCIPLYWGDLGLDQEFINRKALIEFSTVERQQHLKALYHALAEPEAILSQPIFNENAAQLIYQRIYAPIYAYLSKILQVDILDYSDLGDPARAAQQFSHDEAKPENWFIFTHNT
ncbi:hypothetical protein [Psittacicella hinzii]|uniref:Uncharacterized protein n=1 Tax=Psittacicella hinzii TaxID=2028575 RepID=A0A3A1YUW8_9GAMM|nr:hypothetical protein [Psittacicella hinzii]RIY40630.1 hypothetical protein CKF58_00195 [Psittacicella hinzii]